MGNEFASAKYSVRELNAIIELLKKQGGEHGPERFLNGQLALSSLWEEDERDEIIHFSVVSDGTSGEQWISRFEAKGHCVSKATTQILCSPDFKPSSGVTTQVAIVRGRRLGDDARITKTIRVLAYAGDITRGQKLFQPYAEVACLIREKFTDEQIISMGLSWIVTMHQPINDADGHPCLLMIDCINGNWFHAQYNPKSTWNIDNGFAFAYKREYPFEIVR